MTDAALDRSDIRGFDAPARSRVVARHGVPGRRIGKVLVACLGAFVGLTMALSHRLPSGEALRAIAAGPQIRVDLGSHDGAVECVCALPVAYADLPPHLVRALIAYEDRRFRVHSGVDWIGLARALASNLTGGGLQGGSTITQQLARNLGVGDARSGLAGVFRKLREAIVAHRMEMAMTKDEIIAAYLNTADFGRSDGWTAWGVQIATHKYFHKPVQEVNLYEAAQLVGILGGTTAYNPLRNPRAADRRARRVLRAMAAAGLARQSDVAAAIERGARPGRAKPIRFRPGYFIDAALREARAVVGGDGGIARLVVTLAPEEQYAAEQVVTETLAANRDRDVGQGAFVSMRYDGAVTALVGGADYGKSQFNRAADAVRSPGSAFKPFVYVAAIMNGFAPDSRVSDRPQPNGWPRNFSGRYMGFVSLRFALEKSLNAATVELAKKVGVAKIIAMARKLGIATPLKDDLSIALGSGGVTLLDLTSAYGVFANDGRRVTPHLVAAAYSGSGLTLLQRSPAHPERLIDSATAQTIGKLLRGVVTRGTGVAARDPARWSAGKTGTSQSNRDAWFVGFTTDRVTGVWLGNDDGSPMSGVTGGGPPAQAWKRFHTYRRTE